MTVLAAIGGMQMVAAAMLTDADDLIAVAVIGTAGVLAVSAAVIMECAL